MVAVPSIGRASGITPRRAAREADATRELYERYARQIYSFCYRQLGSKEEAEDATQSTFLNAFRGYMRGVDPEYESAWIYKIAENVCLTRQRSSTRRRRVEAASDLDAMQDFVPAHQSDSDELIRLPEALDAMPEQQRRALLLREWQGLSYKEIAEELELSQAAVETLLFRARRSLAAQLTDEPVQQKKGIAKRMRAGGDLGSLVTLVKSILFTGGAKVAATVATVAATSVVAASPVAQHAIEHVVNPTTKPAQHQVTKQQRHSSAHAVKARQSIVAGGATVLAHHAKAGLHAPLSHVHRATATRPQATHFVTTSAPVHTATVTHVESTTDAPKTAATPTQSPAADPAPPTTAATPTTSDTPTTATQPTTSSSPAPTSGNGGTTTKSKDNGGSGTSTATSSSTSSSGATSVTSPSGKTFTAVTTQPTSPTTTTAPSTGGATTSGTTTGPTQPDTTTATPSPTVTPAPSQGTTQAPAATAPITQTSQTSVTKSPTTSLSVSVDSSSTTGLIKK